LLCLSCVGVPASCHGPELCDPVHLYCRLNSCMLPFVEHSFSYSFFPYFFSVCWHAYVVSCVICTVCSLESSSVLSYSTNSRIHASSHAIANHDQRVLGLYQAPRPDLARLLFCLEGRLAPSCAPEGGWCAHPLSTVSGVSGKRHEKTVEPHRRIRSDSGCARYKSLSRIQAPFCVAIAPRVYKNKGSFTPGRTET
jgi:hypothetical protein